MKSDELEKQDYSNVVAVIWVEISCVHPPPSRAGLLSIYGWANFLSLAETLLQPQIENGACCVGQHRYDLVQDYIKCSGSITASLCVPFQYKWCLTNINIMQSKQCTILKHYVALPLMYTDAIRVAAGLNPNMYQTISTQSLWLHADGLVHIWVKACNHRWSEKKSCGR